MSLKEVQSRIKSRVWQGLAQSDVDIKGIDRGTLEKLVELVTEAAMLEVDQTLSQSVTPAQAPVATPTSTATSSLSTGIADSVFDDEKEDVLWEGRPFLSISLHYTITDERILITEGIFGKARENVELVRVQDLDYKQTFGERLFNVGDIIVRSHDRSKPEIVLNNVQEPGKVYEILRRAVLKARRRHNFSYREEM